LIPYYNGKVDVLLTAQISFFGKADIYVSGSILT
jgi:hypothetical protein